MTKTAHAHAVALGYGDAGGTPSVFVGISGPKGGNRGTFELIPDQARSLATQLIAAAAEIDGKPCEIIRLAPFEIAALAAAVGFGDSFTTDWIENEGAGDPDAAEGARQVELAEHIVSRIEAAHGAVANTTAEPASATSIDYTPPEPLPERHFVVRFYQNTTTCDRHCVVVRANDGEEAKARVKAWQLGQIELTEAEERSEELEREGDVVAGEFDGLAEDERYAPFECDKHGAAVEEPATA
jgi:hypothetical protein